MTRRQYLNTVRDLLADTTTVTADDLPDDATDPAATGPQQPTEPGRLAPALDTGIAVDSRTDRRERLAARRRRAIVVGIIFVVIGAAEFLFTSIVERQTVEVGSFLIVFAAFGGLELDARFKEAEAKIGVADSLSQIYGVVAQAVLDLGDSHTIFFPPSRAARASTR